MGTRSNKSWNMSDSATQPNSSGLRIQLITGNLRRINKIKSETSGIDPGTTTTCHPVALYSLSLSWSNCSLLKSALKLEIASMNTSQTKLASRAVWRWYSLRQVSWSWSVYAAWLYTQAWSDVTPSCRACLSEMADPICYAMQDWRWCYPQFSSHKVIKNNYPEY